MATGTIVLDVLAARRPDGSTNNAAAGGPTARIGSQSTFKVFLYTLDFDGAGSTAEYAQWIVRWPVNYASSPVAKLQYMANATSGTVKWNIYIGAVTPGDADTPLEHAFGAANAGAAPSVNATEARRLNEESITLATLDSIAVGDEVVVVLERTPGSDTCTADAELTNFVIEYTTT